MQITVRELRDEDCKELSRIERESFSMPWSEEDFRMLITRDYCCYVVAEVDGKIAGCCGFTNSFGEGNIDNVVVDAAYRGLGIAQEMLHKVLTIGEAQGVEAFTLEVRVSNETAIHVYEKLGFKSEGIRPRFYEKPVEDAMIMWRR